MAPYPTCSLPGEIGSVNESEGWPNGAWFSRCGCGTTTCSAGTYEDAVTALTAHRSLPPEG
jgi:hypothetical protein